MRPALLLLLIPCIAWAGSGGDEKLKVCSGIVNAVDYSRWVNGSTREETVTSFENWAKQADLAKSMLKEPWYLPAVLTLIDMGYAAQDREGWRTDAMTKCLQIAGGQT